MGDVEFALTTAPPSERTTRVGDVVRRVRLEIARGTLSPGLHLVETKLARDLGVSRGTVREALAQLAATGLVESTPGAGHRVRYFSDRDVVEIGEVFSLLEGRAASHATLPLPPDVERELRETALQMRGLRLPDDIEQVMALDRHFHETLMVHQPQTKLQEAWRSQNPLYAAMVVALIRRETDLDVDQAERHLVIVEAAMTGDPERLAVALDEHYRQH